jgi:hypothetical protein
VLHGLEGPHGSADLFRLARDNAALARNLMRMASSGRRGG